MSNTDSKRRCLLCRRAHRSPRMSDGAVCRHCLQTTPVDELRERIAARIEQQAEADRYNARIRELGVR